MATNHDGRKVTIYFTNPTGAAHPPRASSWHGIGSVEARLYETGTKQYAQYDNAAYCHYKPKGARKLRGMVATYRPWLVVLDGWGLPKFDNWQQEKAGATPGVATQAGKYSACDERWEHEGDIFVADVRGATGAAVVADFRHTQGFNAHDRFTPKA